MSRAIRKLEFAWKRRKDMEEPRGTVAVETAEKEPGAILTLMARKNIKHIPRAILTRYYYRINNAIIPSRRRKYKDS